jgi:hypothetical protein
MVAGRHDVGAAAQDFLQRRGRKARAGCGILAVDDDKVCIVFLAQNGNGLRQSSAAWSANDVTEEENCQNAQKNLQVELSPSIVHENRQLNNKHEARNPKHETNSKFKKLKFPNAASRLPV